MKKPQDHKVPIHEDCWYNHFFMSEKLFVVFQDTVMETTTNPGDWDEVIQYGVKHGIPLEQLTFNPRTKDDAFELFELE